MRYTVFKCKYCGQMFSEKELTAVHLQMKHNLNLLQKDVAIRSHYEILS